MLRISYQSEDFPSSTGVRGSGGLVVSWDEILWAAMTVGRPNRQYVFRHGASSVYEALFRLSLVRAAIEQPGPHGYRLRRTNSFKTLDPTEKGAVNYFLGITFCKLFAFKLLDTPWLLHLDVFGTSLGAVLRSRSRPDLIGEDISGNWHAFECKGRAAKPDKTSKMKAKTQAQRLVAVAGSSCQLHIGSFTYFKGDTLHFYWCDPPGVGKALELESEPNWGHYYRPFVETYKSFQSRDAGRVDRPEVVVGPCDLTLSIHPRIREQLLRGEWSAAREVAKDLVGVFSEEGYTPDGLRVIAGSSWQKPFVIESES